MFALAGWWPRSSRHSLSPSVSDVSEFSVAGPYLAAIEAATMEELALFQVSADQAVWEATIHASEDRMERNECLSCGRPK